MTIMGFHWFWWLLLIGVFIWAWIKFKENEKDENTKAFLGLTQGGDLTILEEYVKEKFIDKSKIEEYDINSTAEFILLYTSEKYDEYLEEKDISKKVLISRELEILFSHEIRWSAFSKTISNKFKIYNTNYDDFNFEMNEINTKKPDLDYISKYITVTTWKFLNSSMND